MKKILTLMLALFLCFSFVACDKDSDNSSGNDSIVQYVEEYGDELLESLESSFATASGLTCTSSIKVVGTGFVINININELSDVSDEQKEQLQQNYDMMSSTFDGMLEDLQAELPALTYFTINVCDKAGNVLATIEAGK